MAYTIVINYLSNDENGTVLRSVTPVSLNGNQMFYVSNYSGAYTGAPFSHASFEKNYNSTTVSSFRVERNLNIYFFYDTNLYDTVSIRNGSNWNITVHDILTARANRVNISIQLADGTGAPCVAYIGSNMSINYRTGAISGYSRTVSFTGEWDSGFTISNNNEVYIRLQGDWVNTITVLYSVTNTSNADEFSDITDFVQGLSYALRSCSYSAGSGLTSYYFSTKDNYATCIYTSYISTYIEPYMADGSLFESSDDGISWRQVTAATSSTMGKVWYQCTANRYYELRLNRTSNTRQHNFSIYKALKNSSSNYVNIGNADRNNLSIGTIYTQQSYMSPEGPFNFNAGDLKSVDIGMPIQFSALNATQPSDAGRGKMYKYAGIKNNTDNSIWTTEWSGTMISRSSSGVGARLSVTWTLISCSMFNWDNAKVSGQACNLTANEFNRLRTYCGNAFGYHSSWPAVSSGTLLTAKLYNAARTLIQTRGRERTKIYQYVQQGDAITASLIEDLRTLYNTATNNT